MQKTLVQFLAGRSTREEIGYPLQYSWASLVPQLVKNLLVIRETWVRSLGLAKSLNGWVESCWELTLLEHPPPDHLKKIQDLDCKEEEGGGSCVCD